MSIGVISWYGKRRRVTHIFRKNLHEIGLHFVAAADIKSQAGRRQKRSKAKQSESQHMFPICCLLGKIGDLIKNSWWNRDKTALAYACQETNGKSLLTNIARILLGISFPFPSCTSFTMAIRRCLVWTLPITAKQLPFLVIHSCSNALLLLVIFRAWIWISKIGVREYQKVSTAW